MVTSNITHDASKGDDINEINNFSRNVMYQLIELKLFELYITSIL